MQRWMCARDYQIVPHDQVSIEGYRVPSELKMTEFAASDVDRDIGFVLEQRFSGSVRVRVIQNAKGEQMFLFVRNITTVKFAKNDLTKLCDDYVKLANCIFFSTRLALQSSSSCQQYIASQKYKFGCEFLLLSDVRYAKLRAALLIPHYVILSKKDIEDRERKYKRPRSKFPKIRASCDAVARYMGWKPGMVVHEPSSLMYRLVIP